MSMTFICYEWCLNPIDNNKSATGFCEFLLLIFIIIGIINNYDKNNFTQILVFLRKYKKVEQNRYINPVELRWVKRDKWREGCVHKIGLNFSIYLFIHAANYQQNISEIEAITYSAKVGLLWINKLWQWEWLMCYFHL